MKIFKSIDIYGEPLRLSFNRNYTERTLPGALLTISTLIIGLVFSWLIGKDIYYKQNPFFYQQDLVLDHPQSVRLNRTNYPFFFRMEDWDFLPVTDERFLKLKVLYVQMKMDLATNNLIEVGSKELKLEKTQAKDFPHIPADQFESIGMQEYYTIESQDIDLYGYWNEPALSYLSFGIYDCNYDANSTECVEMRELNEFIEKTGVTLNLIFLDYTLSVSNLTHPNPSFFVNPYKFLTHDRKITNFLIQKDKIQTDSGFFFESYEDVEYLRGVELQSDSALYNQDIKNRMMFNLYASNKFKVYYRKYLKVPEIIASIGGLLKVLNMLANYLSTPIGKLNKFITTIDTLFEKMEFNSGDLNLSPPINKVNNQLPVTVNKIEIVKNNFVLEGIINNLDLTVNKLNCSNKRKRSSQSKLMLSKLTCCNKFRILYKKIIKTKFGNNSSIAYFEACLPYVQNYFDFLNVIRSLHEIEFLKKIKLNFSIL